MLASTRYEVFTETINYHNSTNQKAFSTPVSILRGDTQANQAALYGSTWTHNSSHLLEINWARIRSRRLFDRENWKPRLNFLCLWHIDFFLTDSVLISPFPSPSNYLCDVSQRSWVLFLFSGNNGLSICILIRWDRRSWRWDAFVIHIWTRTRYRAYFTYLFLWNKGLYRWSWARLTKKEVL